MLLLPSRRDFPTWMNTTLETVSRFVTSVSFGKRVLARFTVAWKRCVRFPWNFELSRRTWHQAFSPWVRSFVLGVHFLLASVHFMHQRRESTTNSRSSGLRFDAGRHLFSEGEKNAALFFSFNFRTLFDQPPRCFTGTLLLPLCLFVRPILKLWSIGVTLMRFTWPNHSERRILVSNVSVTYNERFLWILHIGSVSVCLSSSVKSMETSRLHPGIRNPIVVYLMSKRIQRVSPVLWCCSCFFNIATAFLSPFFLDLLPGCSSTWRCKSEHFSPNRHPFSDL